VLYTTIQFIDLERGCGEAGFPPRRLGAHPVFASLLPAGLGSFTPKKALESGLFPAFSAGLNWRVANPASPHSLDKC